MLGLIAATRYELLRAQGYQDLMSRCANFNLVFEALLMLANFKDNHLPLKHKTLRDFNQEIVKILMKIYSMESFIVNKLNDMSTL